MKWGGSSGWNFQSIDAMMQQNKYTSQAIVYAILDRSPLRARWLLDRLRDRHGMTLMEIGRYVKLAVARYNASQSEDDTWARIDAEEAWATWQRLIIEAPQIDLYHRALDYPDPYAILSISK